MLTGRIGRTHVAQFYRQLAFLYDAGIALDRSLEICAHQCSSPAMRKKALRLSEDLRHGVRLSEAVLRAGHPFTALHAGVILAAENTGGYDQAFGELAGWEEKADGLERKISALMHYPLLVSGLAVLGTIALLRFLAPIIGSIIEQAGGEVSAATRLVLLLGQGVWTWKTGVPILLGVVLCLWLCRLLVMSAAFRNRWEAVSLHLPLVGRLIRKAWMIRLARCLDSLLRAGLPIVRCVELAADATGNGYLGEHVLRDAASGLMKGETLTQAIPRRAVSRAFAGLMSVGESTGRLPDMLSKAADLHEVELGAEIESLIRGMEPLVILAVGAVVLGCLVAALQPLYGIIMRL